MAVHTNKKTLLKCLPSSNSSDRSIVFLTFETPELMEGMQAKSLISHPPNSYVRVRTRMKNLNPVRQSLLDTSHVSQLTPSMKLCLWSSPSLGSPQILWKQNIQTPRTVSLFIPRIGRNNQAPHGEVLQRIQSRTEGRTASSSILHQT